MCVMCAATHAARVQCSPALRTHSRRPARPRGCVLLSGRVVWRVSVCVCPCRAVRRLLPAQASACDGRASLKAPLRGSLRHVPPCRYSDANEATASETARSVFNSVLLDESAFIRDDDKKKMKGGRKVEYLQVRADGENAPHSKHSCSTQFSAFGAQSRRTPAKIVENPRK